MSVRSTSTTITASQGSGGTTGSLSTSELCMNLVSEYVQGNIMKSKVTWEIAEVFKESSAHENDTPDQDQSTITSFHSMLDQAKSAWANAAQWGGEDERRGSGADLPQNAHQLYCTQSNYLVVTCHRGPYWNWKPVEVTGHRGWYWIDQMVTVNNLKPQKSWWN